MKFSYYVVGILMLVLGVSFLGATPSRTVGVPKPSPDNTGWRVNIDEADLIEIPSSFTADREGGVYRNLKFLGSVRIAADNITFRNCWFHKVSGTSTIIRDNNFHYGLKFEYCEMDQEELSPGVAASFIEVTKSGGRRCHISYCYFHDFNSDMLGLSRNSYVEYSYFTRWEKVNGYHGDCQQDGLSSENVVFYRNAFHCPWGVDGISPNASFEMTAGGQYSDGSPKRVINFVLRENWINGGGYMVYNKAKDGGMVANCKIIGNKWGRDFKHALLSRGTDDHPDSLYINNVCYDNVWEDTGESVSNGDDGGFSQD